MIAATLFALIGVMFVLFMITDRESLQAFSWGVFALLFFIMAMAASVQ